MTSIHELVSDGTLRMFLAAAHAGSFTLAADDVGVSQSAVSHAIAADCMTTSSRVRPSRSRSPPSP